MILRGYQQTAISKAKTALKNKKNTLLILPTGAGKTVVMSALASEIKGKTLIVQHRQEVLQQNMAKFKRINPDWSVSIFDANTKSFGGDCVMTMAQTLTRNLDLLPKFDHLIHDEVHRCAAPTFAAIIDACKAKNPKMLLTGVTATPERSDKKTLRRFFDNVSHQVTIKDLVARGFLVPPRAYVVDTGVKSELGLLNKQSACGDQREVEKVLDTQVINAEVIRHWEEKASGRQTVVFCSTVRHAENIAKEFNDNGISAACIHGGMSDSERQKALSQYDRGEIQVITNVAVLTEGWDHQPTSCVILLRLCSDKSVMIQMAGRGLRTVDPELYPGVVKKDCLILDFGLSLLTHGDLDQGDGLHEEVEVAKGEAITKTCPEIYSPGLVYHFPDRLGQEGCGAEVPAQVKACPLCGFIFDRLDKKESTITEVSLTELDILNASPFKWLDLFGTDTCLMACGFAAWAGVFSPDRGETWVAIGKLQNEKKVHQLARTGRMQAVAASDDFLRSFEDGKAAGKSKRWLGEPATEKQLQILQKFGYEASAGLLGDSMFTKYSAACHANFNFNKRLIERALGV